MEMEVGGKKTNMGTSNGVLRNPRIIIESSSELATEEDKWVIEGKLLEYDVSSSGVVSIHIIPTNNAVSQIVQSTLRHCPTGELDEKDSGPTPSKCAGERDTRSSTSKSSFDSGPPASAKIDLSEEFVQKNLVGNFRDYYNFRNNGQEDPRIKCIARRFPETKLRALDVGCNDGTITRGLSHLFPNCKFVGVDIDPTLIESAQATTENVELITHDVVENGIPPGPWNVVLFLSVARWIHIQAGDDRLKTILRSFGTEIPPGGLLVMENARWESYKHCLDSLEEAGRHAPDIEFFPACFSDFLTTECGFVYPHNDTWQEFPEYCDSTEPYFRKRPLEFYFKGYNCPEDDCIMRYDRRNEKLQCGWCSTVESPYVCPLCDYRMCASCFELPKAQCTNVESIARPGTPELAEKSEELKATTSQAISDLPQEDDLEAEEEEKYTSSPEPEKLLLGHPYITLAAFTESLVPEGEDASNYLMFQAGEIVELHKKDQYGWVLGTKIPSGQSVKDAIPQLGWLPLTFVKATSEAVSA